jgi:hypothetical protein
MSAPASRAPSPGRTGKQPWRVVAWSFVGAHDWVGRYPAKPGGLPRAKRIVRRPKRGQWDFASRAEAEEFARALRRDDEIITQVVSLNERAPRPVASENQALPGADKWPAQGRRMTGPEWPAPEGGLLPAQPVEPTAARKQLREMLQASIVRESVP